MIDPRAPDYKCTPASADRAVFGYAPARPVDAPQVSIICPFYNGAVPHFDEAAASIFRQSFQNWEFLIVNDQTKSPAALAMLARYRNIDPRVRVIDHTENKGVSAARNTGFAAARAPYVMMMDDDDLLEPTAIEKMLWHLESFPEFAVANGWTVNFGANDYLWPGGFEAGVKLLHSNSATGRALVRRPAHAQAGRHDESIRLGMEDWDFWLRLANVGLWGSTIPEYLDWYRRRDDHKDRWADLDSGNRYRTFCAGLQEKYPRLYAGEFPVIVPPLERVGEPFRETPAVANPLAKKKPRLLMVLPWLTAGGADKFNLDVLEQLCRCGWEVSIVTCAGQDHSWAPQFARFTPDIFALHTFLNPRDYLAFIKYLVDSRRPEIVLISNTEFGYQALPWLRSHCPEPRYVDYLHSESPQWNRGGFPRLSIENQPYLDHTFVASVYLKGWLRSNGGNVDTVDVVRINVDSEYWKPDAAVRARVRSELGLTQSANVITFVGRLHRDKQPQVLAGIFQELARRKVEFAALVIGDGEERAAFEETLARYDLLSQVRILGARSTPEVREFLQASDLLVLTSLWEGIALTLYEAMAVGAAVVAADVGGQKELVTPGTGILLAKGTPAEEVQRYADAIEGLLRDPVARHQMVAAARDRIESGFDIRHMGAAMNAALRAVAAAPPRQVVLTDSVAAKAGLMAIDGVRLLASAALRSAAAPVAASVSPPAALGMDEEAYQQRVAQIALAEIENSRAYRMLSRFKRIWPYRALARLRFGADWDTPPTVDPRIRLTQIKSSNYFRLLHWIKATPPYRWYARRKYGPNWEQSPLVRE